MVVHVGRCSICGKEAPLGWYGYCDNCSMKISGILDLDLTYSERKPNFYNYKVI